MEKYKGSLIVSSPRRAGEGVTGMCLGVPGNKDTGPGRKRQGGREAASGCFWLVDFLTGWLGLFVSMCALFVMFGPFLVDFVCGAG